jgi:hypothetical protein
MLYQPQSSQPRNVESRIMNRSAIFLIFAIGMVAAASAGSIFRSDAPAADDIRAIAGAVNSDGTVARGTGFTAERLSTGTYQITFSDRQFLRGCPIVAASAEVGGAAANVVPSPCRGPFEIMTYFTGGTVDSYFTFIARDTVP